MSRQLQSWVTQQAEIRPDSPAIVDRTQTFTYGQLERSSNQLAQLLQSAGCNKGDRVCILMPKSPDAILSMIGILKAGCMHVPVDACHSGRPHSSILDSCENRWILAARLRHIHCWTNSSPTNNYEAASLLAGSKPNPQSPQTFSRLLPRPIWMPHRSPHCLSEALPMTARTSCSPPARPGCPKASSSPTPTSHLRRPGR